MTTQCVNWVDLKPQLCEAAISALEDRGLDHYTLCEIYPTTAEYDQAVNNMRDVRTIVTEVADNKPPTLLRLVQHLNIDIKQFVPAGVRRLFNIEVVRDGLGNDLPDLWVDDKNAPITNDDDAWAFIREHADAFENNHLELWLTEYVCVMDYPEPGREGYIELVTWCIIKPLPVVAELFCHKK